MLAVSETVHSILPQWKGNWHLRSQVWISATAVILALISFNSYSMYPKSIVLLVWYIIIQGNAAPSAFQERLPWNCTPSEALRPWRFPDATSSWACWASDRQVMLWWLRVSRLPSASEGIPIWASCTSCGVTDSQRYRCSLLERDPPASCL